MESLDPSGPCATMLQGYLFGPFRRAWIQADLAQQCSRGTFSDLFGEPGSKRTLEYLFGPFGEPGSKRTLRKVRLDPGSPTRSEKVPLEHCCARSAWIQGLRIVVQGPKGYPWSIVAQGPIVVQGLLGSPLFEKVPLEHCCARSAWIQGLRKGPKRSPWSIVAQGPLGSRVSEKVRKGTPGALLRKVCLDPMSPKRSPGALLRKVRSTRSEKVPLEHCCARSAWIQGQEIAMQPSPKLDNFPQPASTYFHGTHDANHHNVRDLSFEKGVSQSPAGHSVHPLERFQHISSALQSLFAGQMA